VAWRHDAEDVRAAMAGIVAGYRRHQPVLIALNEMAVSDANTQLDGDQVVGVHRRPAKFRREF
jgi:agmatine/peptidylarginine deiminase